MFHTVVVFDPIWPPSDVQNNVFTRFLDPENVGLAVGIAFLFALPTDGNLVMK